MAKVTDKNWVDWESHAFGYGYGTGEPHVIAALKRFFELCQENEAYDYQVLEAELGPVAAWLLINRLCRYDIGMLEYGSSPRFAWLTDRGRALKAYIATKTVDELVELTRSAAEHPQDICQPDGCNCNGDTNLDVQCPNPFWIGVRV